MVIYTRARACAYVNKNCMTHHLSNRAPMRYDRGMIKRKHAPPKEQIEVDSLTASASRAVYQLTPGMLPRIEFTFTTRDGKITVSMDLDQASRFIQEGINAIEAAVPNIPRPAYRSPIG